MAEFSEVMRQFNRLRNSNACKECPMEGHCGMDEAKLVPDAFEKIVMDWAEAHPEPVYPTWLEWLDNNNRLLRDRIPADIAEKLGIRPKEG